MRVGGCGKSPKNVWWNDMLEDAADRKEVLGAKDEAEKERCIETYEEEKRKDI